MVSLDSPERETAIRALEGIELAIFLGNIAFAYHQLIRVGRSKTYWGSALAQTLSLVWCGTSALAIDAEHVIVPNEDVRTQMYQTCAVFQICSFGLQFAIVLQYLQATQQCLQYRLLWNKLIISLSLLIFLVSAVLVFMGMATVRAETGLNAPMRFGFAIFGAYSSITSIVIAAAVAVMVLHTKRNVVRAREREQPEYAETAKWLESIGRRMAVITLLFVSMTLGVIVYFGRAKAGDRLAATIIKLDGVLIQSWLLYLIHAIRTVSEISTQFGSTTTHEGLTKFATSVAPNTEDRVVVVDAGHKSLRAEEMEPGSTC